MRPIPRPPGWAAAVFLAALTFRLGFLFFVDQPLLYSHQYTYLAAALQIAEHPEPLRYVLTSDEWRTWEEHWTIAPLYHLFTAALFRLLGPVLLALQLVQAVLDSLAAVGVAALGRQLAGPWGGLAGLAYAAYWPAFETPSWTMTENLHTPLLVASVVVLALPAARASRGGALLGGALVGLSALARSVSTVFLGLAALERVWTGGWRRGVAPAALVLTGGLGVVLPWTARNVFVIGEPVLIETAAFENLWYANHLGDRERFRRQQDVVRSLSTPEEKRAAALHFALKGVRERPDLFADKVWTHFWHFLRPDWLDSILRVERPLSPRQALGGVLLEDALLLATLPLFLVFLAAGPPSPTRRLVLLWTAYYLFMIVVVFHNELRYRSALVPLAFAGAAGGGAVLADASGRRGWRARGALVVGLLLVAAVLRPYVPPAARAAHVRWALRGVQERVAEGDLQAARAQVEAASSHDPRSPRPWLRYGRLLVHAGRPAEALEAFARADRTPKPQWIPTLAKPRLLREAGRAGEVEAALEDAHRLSWSLDPWLLLEAAWRDLPPPRADRIDVGGDDYGAVRGFFHPRGGDPRLTRRFLAWSHYTSPQGPRPPPGIHRWTRHRAWLRLVPATAARRYRVTLEMGSPFPSPVPSPEVTVRTAGAPPRGFTLGREVRPYSFEVGRPAGDVLVVRLDAPVWTRRGEPAGQGVRVDRLTVHALP